MTRNVLVISYIFPPFGVGGVYRTAKFVKYLPGFGWDPVVLTVEPNQRSSKRFQEDLPLLQEVSHAKTYRTRSFEPKLWSSLPSRLGMSPKWFFQMPDKQRGWLPFALRAGKRAIREENIDVLYSSSTPYTDHLVALRLHKKTGLPWVADFRDPWTLHETYSAPSAFHRRMEEKMERSILEKASRVVVAWDGIKEGFLKKYPDIPAEKIVTITNGFDPDDFERAKPREFGRFTILFSGAIHEPIVPITPLLEGLKLVEEDVRKEIEVLLIGRISPRESIILEQSGFDMIKKIPYKPHAEFLDYLCGADVLLLLRELEIRVLPGKIFEYLKAQKPILAIIPPEGDAAKLIRKTGAGVVVSPQEPGAVAAEITRLYECWKQGELSLSQEVGEKEQIEQFSRVKLTERLAGIFDSLDREQLT